MKLVNLILITGIISFFAACSTSPKTQVVQIGDVQYTQDQFKAEFAKLDQAKTEIQKKKGITVTNIAAFLFWVPGLAYTYYDADEALKLIEKRRSHLATLYNQKYENLPEKSIPMKA